MLVRRVDNMRPHGFGGGNKMAVASAISHSQISNCLGSIQKSCAISYSGSSSEDGDLMVTAVMDGEMMMKRKIVIWPLVFLTIMGISKKLNLPAPNQPRVKEKTIKSP